MSDCKLKGNKTYQASSIIRGTNACEKNLILIANKVTWVFPLAIDYALWHSLSELTVFVHLISYHMHMLHLIVFAVRMC